MPQENDTMLPEDFIKAMAKAKGRDIIAPLDRAALPFTAAEQARQAAEAEEAARQQALEAERLISSVVRHETLTARELAEIRERASVESFKKQLSSTNLDATVFDRNPLLQRDEDIPWRPFVKSKPPRSLTP